uniref:KIB1-4 beta-propeller domain-containing protein n=1 Tax=Oryza punctata TaxID=4537 RepID=A0A0E0MEA4_ORYPU
MGKVLLVSRDFGVNRVPGTGSLAAAHHHSSRFKVYVVEEHEELEFTRRNKRKTRLTRVRRLDGHALFIGDASCQAIDVTPAGAGCRIKENQICYVDDERNMVVTVAGDGDGGHDWSSLITSCWALRSVQSYDLRTSCFRRYQRPKPPSASPWECVMVQRFLGNKAMIPPPVTELGATLLLWQVISSMGGVAEPSYINELAAADAMVTVRFNVIHGGCLSFTAVGASAQEARQMVAWEAVTFLRTRYRSVLDDTPWDSIPHYHSHVNEIEYDEDFDDDDYD